MFGVRLIDWDDMGSGMMIIFLLWLGQVQPERIRRDGRHTNEQKMVFTANDCLIVYEYATGYVVRTWDDRMHILINITTNGGTIGQCWTKTAFGVTLLRIMNRKWQLGALWFCIITMNIIMILKCIFQWTKICDKDDYQQWYRLNWCIFYAFRQNFKEAGNSTSAD